MVVLQYLLAVALLTSPPDSADIPDNPEVIECLRPTLQAVAIQLEILDPREVRYMLTRIDDFETDLKLLRHRYQDLADAPRLHDCHRFPDRATVNDWLSFNRSYRQHLDARQATELAHWWELRETLQEVDRLYQVWDTVRDARCDYFYVTVRRQALKKLRELVGSEAYYSGSLPPYVPLRRFQQIN